MAEKIFILDTSVRGLIGAVVSSDLVQETDVIFAKDSQSSNEINGFVNSCLTQAKISSLENLDYIFVGCGPGSFTGTRIGLAYIQGLSVARDKLFFGGFDSLLFAKKGLSIRLKLDCVLLTKSTKDLGFFSEGLPSRQFNILDDQEIRKLKEKEVFLFQDWSELEIILNKNKIAYKKIDFNQFSKDLVLGLKQNLKDLKSAASADVSHLKARYLRLSSVEEKIMAEKNIAKGALKE